MCCMASSASVFITGIIIGIHGPSMASTSGILYRTPVHTITTDSSLVDRYLVVNRYTVHSGTGAVFTEYVFVCGL